MDSDDRRGGEADGRTGSLPYCAAKAFVMFGKHYSRGDRVDLSHLPQHKVSQLLDQRYIQPAL